MKRIIYFKVLIFTLICLCSSSCKREKNEGLNSFNKEIIPTSYSTSHIVAKQKKLTNDWWKDFKNEALNKIIEKSLKNNFTIKSAYNRLNQSKAIAKVGGSTRYPHVNGSLTGSRVDTKIKGFPSTNTNQFSVGLSVSYEIDFLGRQKNQVEALDYDVLSTKEDISIAMISIASQITSTWYQLYELHKHLIILSEQLKLKKKDSAFVKTQFKNGQIPINTLWQKQQVVLLGSDELLKIKSNISLLENSMSVLTGRAPGSYHFKFVDGPHFLPLLPKIGIPLDLIQSRPDIRKAYFNLLAADKRIGVAIKDRFPKLSLSASGDSSEEKVSKLFQNWISSLAGNLLAPLIDGGRRKAQVIKEKASYRLLLNQYGDTVINAIREVEDAMILERSKTLLHKSILTQVELAKKMSLIARNKHLSNQINLTAYYLAKINYSDSMRRLWVSQRESIEIRINLYKALASTWSSSSTNKLKKEK